MEFRSFSGPARGKVKGVSLYPNTHMHKKCIILHNVKNPHSGNITLYHTVIVSNILPIKKKKGMIMITDSMVFFFDAFPNEQFHNFAF